MDNTPVLITKDYIMNNRTKKGSWTRKQIQALGIEWPPRAGWINDVTGSYITQEKARQFEAKESAKKDMQFGNIKQGLKKLSHGHLMDIKRYIDLLLTKESK